jgi:MATE family multidrug resistance protein
MDNKQNLSQHLTSKKSDNEVGFTKGEKDSELTLGNAICEVIKNAIPSTFGLLFVFICETINIIFIGRYNNPDLISGIGMGTLYVNLTGYILGAGLIGGLDTLASQAYGKGSLKIVGIYANITKLVIIAFFLFICVPAVYYCSNILLLLGQFEEVAIVAARFAHFMIPSLFFALHYNSSLRYLQAMNIFSPGMYTTFFTVILHPLWCYIFIDVFDYDVAGAGIAMSITQLLNYIIISFYIYYVNPYPESNLPFTLDVFEGEYILKFLKKAIPAAVLFAADWLGFEILTLMSSYLSAVDLAANICLFNYITNIFMISMGLSFACSTLVGNSIGANNVNKAKKYTWAGLICGVCIIGTTTLFTLIFRESIPYVYTSEKEIADKVLELLGIYVCFSIIDAVQVVLNGVIKGL